MESTDQETKGKRIAARAVILYGVLTKDLNGGNFFEFQYWTYVPSHKTLYIYINEEKLYENF